jgi:hypothetical protein
VPKSQTVRKNVFNEKFGPAKVAGIPEYETVFSQE